MIDEFDENYSCNLNALRVNLAKNFGVKPSIWQLYRARTKVLERLCGDHKASYAQLPTYIQMLRDKNPGITIGLKSDGLDVTNLSSEAIFQRLFVSFPAQKIGFVSGCRPFIGIDGCFLKGP